MFAVCVTFQLKAGTAAEFLPLMLENARTSQQTEDGCHQFDVATDEQRPDAVFLYELYTDRAAFDVHLASTHFLAFDAATRGMIAEKSVTTWAKVVQ